MIPQSHINPQALRFLLEYLRFEINQALSERRQLEERWLKWQRQYKQIPEVWQKEFPFLGASNLVLPVGATDSDTIFSRLMGIIWGPDNIWSTRALREDAIDYAPAVQEFLRWAQHAELNAYPATADWMLEVCKIGTGVLKERYRRESKLVYEFRETPQGTVERLASQMVQDNPVLDHVSIYDFLVPSGTINHLQAPWCAERLMLTWPQMQMRERMGIYYGIDRIGEWFTRDRGSWLREEIDKIQMSSPGVPYRSELWEVWLSFDLGLGEPMPLVCTLHLPTMTYLRVDYNPFFHQEYPFDVARYLRQEKQFYGIGIMELQEMFQEEITTMHNQRIDNATLANSVMMKGKKGIGLKDDEPIFPGRWFLLDNMDDVQTLQFGRPFDGTLQNESALMAYSKERGGVNDYIMGNNSPSVGYATAQTNIMQHTEAAKRFDQTLREVRGALGSAGAKILELYQQFNTQGKEYTVLGPKDGELVHQVLQFPTEIIRKFVSVEVTATSASLNKEVQIRTQTILMQLVTQFYEQTFVGMQMVVNPQVPPPLRILAYEMITGNATMMKRLLTAYDTQDVDQIIPDLEAIVSGQAQQLAQLGAGGGAGGANGGVWPQPAQYAAAAGAGGMPAGLLQASGLQAA